MHKRVFATIFAKFLYFIWAKEVLFVGIKAMVHVDLSILDSLISWILSDE